MLCNGCAATVCLPRLVPCVRSVAAISRRPEHPPRLTLHQACVARSRMHTLHEHRLYDSRSRIGFRSRRHAVFRVGDKSQARFELRSAQPFCKEIRRVDAVGDVAEDDVPPFTAACSAKYRRSVCPCCRREGRWLQERRSFHVGRAALHRAAHILARPWRALLRRLHCACLTLRLHLLSPCKLLKSLWT